MQLPARHPWPSAALEGLSGTKKRRVISEMEKVPKKCDCLHPRPFSHLPSNVSRIAEPDGMPASRRSARVILIEFRQRCDRKWSPELLSCAAGKAPSASRWIHTIINSRLSSLLAAQEGRDRIGYGAFAPQPTRAPSVFLRFHLRLLQMIRCTSMTRIVSECTPRAHNTTAPNSQARAAHSCVFQNS